MSDANGKKRTMLKYPQLIRLTDMMRSKGAEYMEKRPNVADVAVEMSKLCGFHVSEGNVQGAMDAIGLKWRAKPRGRGKRVYNTRVRAVAAAVLEIAQALSLELSNAAALKDMLIEEPQHGGSAK